VRPIPLWRYEIRRAGRAALLGPPLATVLIVLFTLADRSDGAAERAGARNLFGILEMALPLVAGVGAAALVGRDPAAELQLTMPTAYRATLLRRLAVGLGCTALVALLIGGFLMIDGSWEHGVLAGQLIWLAPTLWLAALGLLGGAVFRSPGAAGGLVAVLWLVEQIFAGVIREHGWSRLLYLFATTRGTTPGDWAGNRLTLVGTAIVLGVAAWLLLGRIERLINEEAE
jgi:hypothetical protein